MIVAITGGTGFIGRRLIARHRARGDHVRYLTRNPSVTGVDGATLFLGNLVYPDKQLQKFARGADVLYHCAAELHRDLEMHNTNVRGTANLIDAAGGEVGRWVQLSSTGVYGMNVRGARGDIDENSAIDPRNPYETSKAASDNVLREAAARQHFSYVVVQPSNVYGWDMPNQSLFQMIKVIDKGLFFFIGSSGAMANYVHVDNVIDALSLCGTANLAGNGRTYIVSDHRKLDALVSIIACALGKAPPTLRLPESLVRAACMIAGRIPGFPLSLSRVDALTSGVIYRSHRIRSELGFENNISMEAGIGELVRYVKNRMIGA